MDVFNRLGLALWNSWSSLPFQFLSLLEEEEEEEEEGKTEEVVESGARENFPLRSV